MFSSNGANIGWVDAVRCDAESGLRSKKNNRNRMSVRIWIRDFSEYQKVQSFRFDNLRKYFRTIITYLCSKVDTIVI